MEVKEGDDEVGVLGVYLNSLDQQYAHERLSCVEWCGHTGVTSRGVKRTYSASVG